MNGQECRVEISRMSTPEVFVKGREKTSRRATWILLFLLMFAALLALAACLLMPVDGGGQRSSTDPDLVDEFYDQVRLAFDRQLRQSLREAPPEAADMTTTTAPLGGEGWAELTAASRCDRLEGRTCVYVRQIGTTLTFAVRTPPPDPATGRRRARVRWFRCFKRLGAPDLREEITPDDLPWNMNIGGEGDEFRISPVTETDFSYNYFVATVEPVRAPDARRDAPTSDAAAGPRGRYVKFSIEPIDVDMGVLYHGEELTIPARAFMELPARSVRFRWMLARPDDGKVLREGLPSNMKATEDGSSVVIKELRAPGDKVLVCSVYTNKNVFVARRNFLIRRIEDKERSAEETEMQVRRRRKRSLSKLEFFEGEDLSSDLFPIYHYSSRNKNLATRRRSSKKRYHTTRTRGRSPEADEEGDEAAIASPPPLDTALFYEADTERAPFAHPLADQQQIAKKPPDEPPSRPLQSLIQEANGLAPDQGQPDPLRPDRLSFEDRESRLLSDCSQDADCSTHARCHSDGEGRSFCRCLPGRYVGNGLFCWVL